MNDLATAAPLSPAQLRHILMGLMLGVFLAALDQTVVAVALPTISQQLPGSGLLAWIMSGYMLALTVTTPILGKLSDLFGRRRLLMLSIGLFVLASVFCGLAQSMQQLVGARVLQGIGAGGMMAIIQALVGDLIAPAERGRYQAWFSGMFALASLLGPSLGGFLSSQLSWRWVFWINLPLGAIAMWLCWSRLAGLVEIRRRARIDYFGCALLIIGLSSLLLLITELGEQPVQVGPSLAVTALLALVGLSVFIWHQRRTTDPLIPPLLLRIAAIRSGWSLLFFANFQAIGLAVVVPLQLQGVGGMGESASQLMALAFGAPIGAYIGGRLSAHLARYKPPIISGALLVPVALTLLAFVDPGSFFLRLPVLLLCGISLGLQFPTSLVAVQNAAPKSHLGVATGVCGLFRGFGGAVGAALLSSLLWHLLPSLAHGQGAFNADDSGTVGLAFRHLLLIDAAIALIPLVIALRMEDRPLSLHQSKPAESQAT